MLSSALSYVSCMMARDGVRQLTETVMCQQATAEFSLLGKVALATISSGSRRSNSYACKRGEWCGVRHLRTTSASTVGQFGLARDRYRTLLHPRRHRTAPSGQPVLSTETACAHGVLPLYVHQPLAGNNLLGFVREASSRGDWKAKRQPALSFIRSSRRNCGAILQMRAVGIAFPSLCRS